MRGRVMSLVVLVSRGGTNLAGLQAGLLVAAFGPVVAAVVGALAVAGAVGGAAAASPALRGLSTARRVPTARAPALDTADEEVER